MARKTNEWEFQGQLLSWINADLKAHDYGFEVATQEFPNADGKRSDIVIWVDHAARKAVLEAELKTPTTPMSDSTFRVDAVRKAQAVAAPYVALWNMRDLQLYRTPPPNRKFLLASDLVADLGTVGGLGRVQDWVDPPVKEALEAHTRELLIAAYDLQTRGSVGGVVVDATVFTDFLAERVAKLRQLFRRNFAANLGRDAKLRRNINVWARKQGLTAFVDDVYVALSAQLAYRVVGQALFYHAFRKRELSLRELRIDPEGDVPAQLRVFWEEIRAFDYEALFEASPLELVPLDTSAQRELGALINELSHYDWRHIDDDVLGAVFERLIPEPERIALGQYYTKPEVADFVLSFTHTEGSDPLLDPAVGTGTFLMRAHNRLRRVHGLSHDAALEKLWGFDVSAFPAELAVINLCRLDFDSANNYPRIAVRDFFEVDATSTLEFPPAKRNPGSTVKHAVRLPEFHAVVGNPPYVRSQQLDDLDKGYKTRLAALVTGAGLPPEGMGKLDAYAYFFLHAEKFLRDGGRIGFVTSAAWLSSTYGLYLQRFLLERFQPVAIIWSESEPLFPSQGVDTVISILEKLSDVDKNAPRTEMRFVTLKRALSDIFPSRDAPDYWARVDSFVDVIEASADVDLAEYRVRIVAAQEEVLALRSYPKVRRNWVRHLKGTPIYRDIFGG